MTVAGRTADRPFLVPLELVALSAPSPFNRLTAFTADLVGPPGTRLTTPGRYQTVKGGQRFNLMLSWVTRHPGALHYRATFVHRIPVQAGEPAASTSASTGATGAEPVGLPGRHRREIGRRALRVSS